MTRQRDGTNAPAGDDRPTTNRSDEQRRATEPGEKRTMPPARSWLWFALILLANVLIVRFLLPGPEAPVEVPYTFFKEEVRAGTSKLSTARGIPSKDDLRSRSPTRPKGREARSPGRSLRVPPRPSPPCFRPSLIQGSRSS
jgi:hypothetical protein